MLGDMKKSALAAAIERVREERGLSQKELAARAGVTPEAVSRYESGQRVPRGRYLAALAMALGVEPAALLVEPEPPVAEPDLVARMAELEAVVARLRAMLPGPVDFSRPEGRRTIGLDTDEAASARMARTEPPLLAPAVDLRSLSSTATVAAYILERRATMREARLIALALEDVPLAASRLPGQEGWLLDLSSHGEVGECVLAQYAGQTVTGWVEGAGHQRQVSIMGGPTVPLAAVVVLGAVAYRMMRFQQAMGAGGRSLPAPVSREGH